MSPHACGAPRPGALWPWLVALLSMVLLTARAIAAPASAPVRPPNVVLIFCDDLGYGDLGCYGSRTIKTPHLDRLARQGTRFTDFYAAQAVCSASRAALLTGCYPNRVGIAGALDHRARHGLNPDEDTIAERLRSRGYATGMVGKWHLGHLPRFLPTRQGFGEWFGLPYSNDMWPFHPEAKPGSYPALPLFDGERIVDDDVRPEDQQSLTTRYTDRAVDFISRHHTQPFFLYLAHSMPHVPLFVRKGHEGRSRAGLYGDVLAEIDDSVGRIVQALDRHRIADQTIVLFTSDNGPWLSYGDHAGSSGPLREGKGTAWEGGVRVPFLARWPGRIPAGSICREPAMTIDLLPTLCEWAGASVPSRPIDGLSIVPLLEGRAGAKSPHVALWFYYNQNELQALRSGPWKLILPHTYRTLGNEPRATGGTPVRYRSAQAGLELYRLDSDPGETTEVAASHPTVVKQLLALVEDARADLGDSLTQRAPQRARPAGSEPAEQH